MIFSELEPSWDLIRREVLNFERALALISPQLQAKERSVIGSLDVITRSALEDSLRSLSRLKETSATYGDAVVMSLERSLARRLLGWDIQVSLYTRLALWERLWIALSTPSRPLAVDQGPHYRAMGSEIARVAAALKSDPLWSPVHVYQRRLDFQAERAIAQIMNHSSGFEGISAECAPLDADLLHGLDLSVKREHPKARAWIQVSLSAERELNQSKLKRLKRSAAVALLSPWTLAGVLISIEPSRSVALCSALKLNPSASQESTARKISQILKALTLHVELNADPPDDSARRAIITLMRSLIERSLGRKASRKYLIQRGAPEAPEHLLYELSLIQGGLNPHLESPSLNSS